MKKSCSFSLPAVIFAVLILTVLSTGCSKKDNGSPAFSEDYVVFAWNDLGMHCLNPTYDKAVILPPYNNLMAQVVLRGNPPKIITDGITVDYRIIDNTTSYGKREYGGFWDNITALFGLASLEHDRGLTGNKLNGSLAAASGYFEATGIPVTPVNDLGVWDPLQVAEVTVKDASGKVIATTRPTVQMLLITSWRNMMMRSAQP